MEATRIASVGVTTAQRYLLACRGSLSRSDWHIPVSELAGHADAIRTFRAERPILAAVEAAQRQRTRE